MSKELFDKAANVLFAIEKAGFQAYIVGGAVRDYLLGRPVEDIDIASSATPEDMMSIFEKVIPVGIEHGTVIVRYESESFEVTTFRTESSYSDFRHPDVVEYVGDIYTDLARRDYTINAIAMNQHFERIDPFEGEIDLKQATIRTVGPPNERFTEDPLRMMRGIRFVSQIGFHMNERTLHAIQKNAELLQYIAMERIAVEWEKLISGSYVKKAISQFLTSRLIYYIPVFSEDDFIRQTVESLEQPLDHLATFLAICHVKQPKIPIQYWQKQWKLSNQTVNQVISLVRAVNNWEANKSMNWIVYQLPDSLFNSFSLVLMTYQGIHVQSSKLASVQEQLPIQTRNELKVNGNDLMNWFPNQPKGPWISQWLAYIEEAVVDGELSNDHTEISEWIKNESNDT
ncbi:CCA-adding enzyme [Gracilibacillus halophilus YIM-C55.5]|uniref:CCA-adding enzyme n=1 Tax=Gracilibacillus halophilus YIM-C55.5 TaxID=1308866 RepID=N4WW56_9BACI|nr:CCA tRNA nucleotidyltransferase [Gracilibacillus halophilus]ENH97321.1 CCA-adding enzyme [Gracilibacillus halophilus YIM-C55.5]